MVPYNKDVTCFRWACLLEGSLDDPWTAAVATRKTVALFDARRGNGGGPRVLCRSARGEPLDEIITAVARDDALTSWIHGLYRDALKGGYQVA